MLPSGQSEIARPVARRCCGVGISKGDAQQFNFCNIFNVVTFLRNVLREDRSDPAPGQSRPGSKCGCRRIRFSFRPKALISDLRLHTVCESAQCPNRWECWSQGTATFMIAGDRCTRACGFCAVTTAKPFALGRRRTRARRRGGAPDEFETRRDHCGGARRFEGRRRRTFCAHDHRYSRDGSLNHHRSAGSGFSRT